MTTKVTLPTTVRPLNVIAAEITADPAWKGNTKIFSEPYLDAMISGHVRTVTDAYGADDGEYLVRYAISNLAHYRGDTAKRVKAELKAHLAGVKPA